MPIPDFDLFDTSEKYMNWLQGQARDFSSSGFSSEDIFHDVTLKNTPQEVLICLNKWLSVFNFLENQDHCQTVYEGIEQAIKATPLLNYVPAASYSRFLLYSASQSEKTQVSSAGQALQIPVLQVFLDNPALIQMIHENGFSLKPEATFEAYQALNAANSLRSFQKCLAQVLECALTKQQFWMAYDPLAKWQEKLLTFFESLYSRHKSQCFESTDFYKSILQELNYSSLSPHNKYNLIASYADKAPRSSVATIVNNISQSCVRLGYMVGVNYRSVEQYVNHRVNIYEAVYAILKQESEAQANFPRVRRALSVSFIAPLKDLAPMIKAIAIQSHVDDSPGSRSALAWQLAESYLKEIKLCGNDSAEMRLATSQQNLACLAAKIDALSFVQNPTNPLSMSKLQQQLREANILGIEPATPPSSGYVTPRGSFSDKSESPSRVKMQNFDKIESPKASKPGLNGPP